MATIGKYETAGATLYEVRYRTPDRRSTRRRGFTTMRDAKAFAATVETSKLKGEYVGAAVGRTTIGELGPLWLERQRGHIKPGTAKSYGTMWRVHIEPRWGDMRISEIQPSDVQAWVANMSTSHGPVVIRQGQ